MLWLSVLCIVLVYVICSTNDSRIYRKSFPFHVKYCIYVVNFTAVPARDGIWIHLHQVDTLNLCYYSYNALQLLYGKSKEDMMGAVFINRKHSFFQTLTPCSLVLDEEKRK